MTDTHIALYYVTMHTPYGCLCNDVKLQTTVHNVVNVHELYYIS